MGLEKLNPIILDFLLSNKEELEWLEFKKNGCDPHKLGEILSGVSNSANLHGRDFGYVVFGVDDQTKDPCGTTFNPWKEKVGNEELENWLIQRMTPKPVLDIFEIEKMGKRIVVFKIASPTDRPIDFENVAYIRIGTLTKNIKSFPDYERKIWQNIKNRNFEKQNAIECVGIDEIIALLDYPYFFEITEQPLPDNKKTIIKKLLESRMIGFSDGVYSITNLGGILFAKDLRKFERLNRKAPRVIIYDGKDKINTKLEQHGVRGYARAFPAIIDFIRSKLPSNEVINKALRVEKKMYPEIAIRELVANALVHQDLFETGTSPMIEIYDDRIEITNSGKPLVETDRFIDHPPKSRNEDLASFMRQIRICEERGSGIDKVIKSIELYQLPAPKFEANEQFTKVTLFAYKKLSHMDKEDKCRACYQHCVLRYVSNELMNNSSLRDRFSIKEKNYSIASRIIADTVKGGLIKQKDPESTSKKFVTYIPVWA